MRFFTDECFPMPAVRLVQAFDRVNEVIPLLERFNKGTPDTAWISEVATWTPKPVVISGDGRILRNKVEVQALQSSRLTFVCLKDGWMNMGWHDIAWKIVKAWPAIAERAGNVIRPTVFELSAQTLKIEPRRAL